MRSRLLQSDIWQFSMYCMHDGVYDNGWYGYWSNRAEPMQHVCGGLWRHICERWQQRMHDMRGGVLQSDGQQCGVHGVHDGVYNDERRDDWSYRSESVQHVCSWI